MLVEVDATYRVTVELQTYTNPTHFQAQDNALCDSSSISCDNRFRFCFTETLDIPAYSDIISHHPEEIVCGCQFSTRVFDENNDSISFPRGRFGGNTHNPLVFEGDRWPVS